MLTALLQGGVATGAGSCLQDLPVLPWMVLPQANGGQPRLHRSEARSTHVSSPGPSGAKIRQRSPKSSNSSQLSAAAEDPHRQLF